MSRCGEGGTIDILRKNQRRKKGCMGGPGGDYQKKEHGR